MPNNIRDIAPFKTPTPSHLYDHTPELGISPSFPDLTSPSLPAIPRGICRTPSYSVMGPNLSPPLAMTMSSSRLSKLPKPKPSPPRKRSAPEDERNSPSIVFSLFKGIRKEGLASSAKIQRLLADKDNGWGQFVDTGSDQKYDATLGSYPPAGTIPN